MVGKLPALVAEIPGLDGWWRQDNQRVFEETAQKLIAKGFSEEEAVGILQTIYNATAEEFGNS